jgi:hypothetical protein
MTEPFRRRPTPRPSPPEALEAFLTGAETPALAPPPVPWTQGRPDVIKTYVLRLPEPYHLKLQYIAAHTPYSMQRFLQEVVYAAIDQKIAELTASPGREAEGTGR